MIRQCKECGVSPIRGRITHKWQCPTNRGKVFHVEPKDEADISDKPEAQEVIKLARKRLKNRAEKRITVKRPSGHKALKFLNDNFEVQDDDE